MVYDVAIVGGGPAGARTAWRLGRAGARVALIDASHPREKPCGGGVTGRALDLVRDQLGHDPADPPYVMVAAARFEREGGAPVSVPLGSTAGGREPRLAIFSRARFDQRLFDAALGSGAVHVRDRARDIEMGTGVSRVLSAGGGSVQARWIVGADGANSLVRRRVSRPFDRSELSIAAGFFAHGVTATEIAVEFTSAPAGYLWCFPRPDHLAIGACAQADVSTAAALRGVARRWIARGGIGGTLAPYAWPIPSLTVPSIDRQRPAGDGWLLAGDAAGLVDPITREGIFLALRSADFAAEALIEGEEVASRYAERVRDEIFAELRRAAALKAGFFRPAFTSLLVDSLRSSAAIRGIMADLTAGEQPYRTLVRRLCATLEFRLAWRVLRLRRRGA